MSAASCKHGAQNVKAQNNTPLIPIPVSEIFEKGEFELSNLEEVSISTEENKNTAQFLLKQLEEKGIHNIKLSETSEDLKNTIRLELGDIKNQNPEAYKLTINKNYILIQSSTAEGLSRGSMTLMQIIAMSEDGKLQARLIDDYPRYAYRGTMLDVSRHFFSVEDVKSLIDQIALYKVNYFHLHLTDDQGWRIMINSWPKLAEVGGLYEVGGGQGGYFTQEDYKEIVAHAQKYFITVVPEIDMPGHTNAALVAYPELNCDGKAPEHYTGMKVGFSSLCVEKELTYEFIDDVIREVAAITPGPYIHIGGDEAESTSEEDYKTFISRVQPIVKKYNKTMIGWEEIAEAELYPSAIVQQWRKPELATMAVGKGNKVLLSPSPRMYLDMKYNEKTEIGLDWAGTIELDQAYDWDPATEIEGVNDANTLGVEAPLWTETVETKEHIEYLVFPRMLAYAEIGWSPQELRQWEDFRKRLGQHAPLMKAKGISYYPSPLIEWVE